MSKKIKENKDFLIIIYLLCTIIVLCITQIINRAQIKELSRDVKSLTDNYKITSSDIIIEKYYNVAADNNIKVSQIEENAEEDDIEGNRWNITLSEEEIDLLAQIVWLEAGNQPQEGQMAVVEVVFNRMTDSYYCGTLEEVLSRPRQFYTWKNRSIAEPTTETYESIYKVLYGESDILPYNTLYFGRSSNGRIVEIKIGDHYFCN